MLHKVASVLHKHLQVALQQADYAAWNVWATINGRPLLPFKYQHLGELMSLGSGGAYNLPVSFPKGVTLHDY